MIGASVSVGSVETFELMHADTKKYLTINCITICTNPIRSKRSNTIFLNVYNTYLVDQNKHAPAEKLAKYCGVVVSDALLPKNFYVLDCK